MKLILKSYHGDTLKKPLDVVFYCHSDTQSKQPISRRYSSGQRGQTVNLLTYVYEGSNPSRRTVTIIRSTLVGRFLSVRRSK